MFVDRNQVFRGIGGVAHKYYMLFQHHLPPPPSTYTSDAVHAAKGEPGQGLDPNQTINSYVHPAMIEPGYVIGAKHGVSSHHNSSCGSELTCLALCC